MDVSKPMVPAKDKWTEYDLITNLWNDCESLLLSWKVYKFTPEDELTDAVIAITELQREIVMRRAFILGIPTEGNIPF